MKPSTNGTNGRDSGGRFAKGNAGGPGNPHARRVARLRSALLRAVTPADLKAVLAALVKKAKRGDVAAARELLDRLFGKGTAPVVPLGADETAVRVEFDPDFYGNAERIRAGIEEQLKHPDYLDWLRERRFGREGAPEADGADT
jgi:hypothetical protein